MAIFTPNDKYWNDQPGELPGFPGEYYQWGAAQIGADVAWDLTGEGTYTSTGAENIVIAMIDTGIFYDAGNDEFHEDLDESVLWRNHDEYPGDNDGADDGYPGLEGVDDDDDGGTDFDDEEVMNSDYDGNGMTFWEERQDPQWPDIEDCPDYDRATKDDDENGYFDDFHGYDFVNNDNEPWDDVGHGTLTSGIAAALTDNEVGIAGMAQVKVMVIKMFDPPLGWDAAMFYKWCDRAFEYAIDNGADIISYSAGGQLDPPGSSNMDAILSEAQARGVLVVAAVGNGGWNPSQYPARRDSVVGVGATVYEDEPPLQAERYVPVYSQHDPSVVAPGGYDYTGTNPEQNVGSTYFGGSDEYAWRWGTSLSTPHVSGLAALMMSYRPSMSPQRIFQVLNATAIDITDEPGPKRCIDCTPGEDQRSGWGEVNSPLALGYSQYMKDRWSDSLDVQFILCKGEDKQPQIAVDSYGYSHFVYLVPGLKDTVWYELVDDAGRIVRSVCMETGAEINFESAYPDVYVDKNDKAHIAWLEYDYWGAGDEILYRTIDGSGQLSPIKQVTNTGTSKESVNIVTDQGCTPFVVFGSQNPVIGWEILAAQEATPNWWISSIIGDATYVYRKPSTDIIEMDGEEVILTAHQRRKGDASDDKEIMITGYQLPNKFLVTKRLSDNDYHDINPNICTVHQDGLAYVVWTAEDCDGIVDKVKISALKVGSALPNAPTISPITYGRRDIKTSGIDVGNPSNDLASNLAMKKYPKVAAGVVGEISPPYDGTESGHVIQVNVFWTEYIDDASDWYVCYSELTRDGRSMTESEQSRYVVAPGGEGFPQVTASQLRASSRDGEWLDFDGNFRLLYYGSYAGQNRLWYASTRERWRSASVIEQSNAFICRPDIHIDEEDDLHMVYCVDGKVKYAYWKDSRPPNNPTIGPQQITQPDHFCDQPKVTTYIDQGTKYVVVIYKDYTIQVNGEIMYMRIRIDTTPYQIAIEDEEALGCVEDHGTGSYIDIANNRLDEHIGVVWVDTIEDSDTDVFVGIVDYTNTEQLHETNLLVGGVEDERELYPRIDVDPLGDYHIVYEMDSDVYYNGVTYVDDDYESLHANDIKVDGAGTEAHMPSIKVDRDTRRRTENDYRITGFPRSNWFVHIAYMVKYTFGEDIRWGVMYVKMNIGGSKVIPEKIVTKIVDQDYLSRFHDIWGVDLNLNSENQVSIVYSGIWMCPVEVNPKYRVAVIKLDHNGEVLTQETYVSPRIVGMIDWCSNPCAEYDASDQLNVAWVQWVQGQNAWQMCHCTEVKKQ